MSFQNVLKRGFTKNDAQKVITHLKRLVPYLTTDKFVLVGGVAIRYHVIKSGLSYPKRPVNDLDIIAADQTNISAKITKDFLVYHYHQTNEAFYLALVDPVSRTKVDIFNSNPLLANPTKVVLGQHNLNLIRIENQLVQTTFDVSRISASSKVDPKQFQDLQFLVKIADLKQADAVWRKRKYKQYPKSLRQAIQRAKNIANFHPDWLQEKPFRKPHQYTCPECQISPIFPLTSMAKIYQLLGYVE